MPNKFDNSIVSQIQQATDIVEVISEHLSLDRKGKEFVGLCPFHTDHKPSMFVNPVKQIFKCFACGAGGDAFKFIQMRENLSFPEAIERLAQRAGIQYRAPKRRQSQSEVPGEISNADPGHVARANDWAMKLWQDSLLDEQKGAVARNYVESRQITDESVKEWGIGFAPDGWDNLVKAARIRKVPERLLLESGLVVARDERGIYDKFRNRLMFPIFDATGRVIGFGGRTLGDDPAKYMNSPATVLFDKSNSLYGLDKARHGIVSSGTAVVVEGYTDVIMSHQFGCKNVVAALGTSFTAGHAMVLRRYAKRIVLVFDSDVAGMEAANRALEVCLSQKIDIKLAFAGEGKDPCDFLLTEGAEAFDRLVENATDVMEYKWQRLLSGLSDSDNMTDKRQVIDEYLRTVATAMHNGRLDSLTEGMIVGKLSDLIGLSHKQIKDELSKHVQRFTRNAVYTEQNKQVRVVNRGRGSYAEAQKELLAVLVNEPSLYDKVAGKVKAEDFDLPVCREIAESLFDLLESGARPQLRDILAGIESPDAAEVITDMEKESQDKGNFQMRIEDAVGVIEEHFDGVRRRRIIETLSEEDNDALERYNEMIVRGTKGQRSPGMIGS